MYAHASRLAPPEWDIRWSGIGNYLQENGLGGLLVYGTGQHNLLLPDYLMYCTGFIGVGAHSLLLLVPGEQPELVVSSREDVDLAREIAWMACPSYAADPAAAMAERVKQRGLTRVAVAGRLWMPYEFHARLAAGCASQASLVPGDAVLEDMARVKSPEERERVRRAAAIADAAFAALLAAARPGVADYELAAEVDYVVKSLGAADNFGMISAQACNANSHPPTGRRLEPGDIILAEISPCYGGYFAQLCRSIAVGGLRTAGQKRDATLQQSAFDAALRCAQPGKPVGVIARAINDVMSSAGYAQYSYPPYMRSRGHGMGLGSMSPGEITEENNLPLEPGMTFIIHPNQYFPETGYLLLGDSVEVTADGVRSLLRTPAQIMTV